MQIKVNGVEHSFDGDPDLPLLWYLRDVLGLTGTKFGCGMALCGACTVHQDGKAVRSCVTKVSATAGNIVNGTDHFGWIFINIFTKFNIFIFIIRITKFYTLYIINISNTIF